MADYVATCIYRTRLLHELSVDSKDSVDIEQVDLPTIHVLITWWKYVNHITD